MGMMQYVLLGWLGLSIGSFLTPISWGEKVLRAWRATQIVLAITTFVLGLHSFIFPGSTTFTLTWLSFPYHPSLRLDGLSAFFILLLGASTIGVSCFSLTYYNHFTLLQQKQIQSWQALFLFALLLVFLANDPILFLLAWEFMALSSYFLVMSVESGKTVRRAGFLYASLAHVSLLCIAVALFLLAAHHDDLSSTIAGVVFILSLLGFGAKAGLYPLHIWLPEAHPAAPSPISGLLSGVMLKTAVYGLLRFLFYFLLPFQQVWWGYTLVIFGLLTMLMGIIHAAMQRDMKRLLAYSSIENMGFIITAIGLALIFYQYHDGILANLALIVALLHSLNHSLFKSLLFLGTGSILHATGERNLGKLGGLIHKMPWVAACTFVGTLAMAGLPLFNGFIGEWLYLSIFFRHNFHAHFNLAMLSPLIVALSILVFGLAGYVIVKFFGIAFLGRPREPVLQHATPASTWERLGLLWLALGCLLLGLWPQPLLQTLQTLTTTSIPYLLPAVQTSDWVININPPVHTALGFNPLLLGISVILVLLLLIGLLRRLSPSRFQRVIPWNGGYPSLTARMQDTAEGFGQPFKQIFAKLIDIKLTLPQAKDPHPSYHSQLNEKIWRLCYNPLITSITWIASLTKWIQQGKITTYLTYMGVTLLILLIWVVWS